MAQMSPGTALRQVQQAQAGMRKARRALSLARAETAGTQARQGALVAGWDSLVQAHRLLAAIPLEAANEPVMTKQLAAQRYATALLVRLRRIVRNDPETLDDLGDDLDDEDEGEG